MKRSTRTRSKQKVPKVQLSDINVSLIYENEIPLTKAKYDDLMLLCKEEVVPRQYHKFFEDCLMPQIRVLRI